MTSRLRRIRPATPIALLALFVALGGPAEAARLINGTTIRKGTVRSKQIKDHTLTSRDLSRGTVRGLRAGPASSIGAAQIRDGSVTLAKLATGSVTGNQVADRSLSAADLAADTLTAVEIAPSAIGDSELASNAVTNRKLRTGAVTKGKIGTGAVGTAEVIDHDLRGGDLAAETAIATFSAVLAGQCAEAPDVTVPALPAPAAPATATSDVVLVGQFSDDLTVTGRATSATTLRFKACNTSATPTAALATPIRYLAIAP